LCERDQRRKQGSEAPMQATASCAIGGNKQRRAAGHEVNARVTMVAA